MERVYYKKTVNGWKSAPTPTPIGLALVWNVMRRLLVMLPRLAGPLSLVDTVNMFRGSRRKRMQAALISLMKCPLTSRDFILSSFVKAEKWAKESAPRLIQAWKPRATLVLASFLKPIEERIYHAIDRLWAGDCGLKGPTVMKCLNGKQRAARFAEIHRWFARPCYIGADAHRFDQHVHLRMLQLEHRLYGKVYGEHPMLRWLLENQLRQKGVIPCDDGVIHYSVIGTRSSGHINTSLGNVLIMCCMAYAYIESIGLVPGKDVILVNDGDDCVFCMEEHNKTLFTAKFSEFFLSCGFDMAVEQPVTILEEVEFCQCKPVHTGNEWVMVRNPVKCVNHDLHFIDFDTCMIPSVLNAVGYCGGALYAGVPVLQAFYARLRTHSLDRKLFADARFRRMAVVHLSPGADARVEPIAESARVSFWRAFGISPHVQLLLEEAYADCSPRYDFSPSQIPHDSYVTVPTTDAEQLVRQFLL
jgi:hypothetical protein